MVERWSSAASASCSSRPATAGASSACSRTTCAPRCADLPDARVEPPHGRLSRALVTAARRTPKRPRRARARLRPGVALGRAPSLPRNRIRGHRAPSPSPRRAPARDPRAARVVQGRGAPADKRFPMRSMEIVARVGARVVGGDGPARRRAHARAAHRRRGHVRRRLRLCRNARRAGRPARRRLGPRAPPALGRHRLARRGLAGGQARPRARRRSTSTRRPSSARSPRTRSWRSARMLARWQALRSVTVVPFTDAAEAAARRRPRRAGGRPLPPHDDAHRRRASPTSCGATRW